MNFDVFTGSSAIVGIGYWVPERIETAAELESRITAFPGNMIQLEKRAGLRQKRVCEPGVRVIDAAMKAVEALESKGFFSGEAVNYDDIDCIIYCSVRREHEEPSTAALIQKRLGIKGMAFDVSNACLGFTDSWMIADSMIKTGKINRALIVTAEMISVLSDNAIAAINRGEDPKPHFASLTVGDAAAAVVIDKKGRNKGINLLAGTRKTFSEHVDDCILPGFDQCMLSDASALMAAALDKYPAMAARIMQHLGWTVDDLERIVPHQPSVKIIKQGADLMNFPHEKLMILFPEYGNCASASVPMGIAKTVEEFTNWENKKILSIGFGSGLGVGVFGLETYRVEKLN